MNDIDQMEKQLIVEMLQDIQQANDPVEQFRGIERYHKFVEAREIRVATDASCNGKAKR